MSKDDHAVEVVEFALRWLDIKSRPGPTEKVWPAFVQGVRSILRGEGLPEDIEKSLKG